MRLPAPPSSTDSCIFWCSASHLPENEDKGEGWNKQIWPFWVPATRAGKVDIVTINDPFIDLNYMDYMQAWQIAQYSKSWEWATYPQWKAHLYLLGARSRQHQTEWCWCWVCCDVDWGLYHHGDGWGSYEGWSQEGHHLLPLWLMPTCLWWAWTMICMTTLLKLSAMTPALLFPWSSHQGHPSQFWHHGPQSMPLLSPRRPWMSSLESCGMMAKRLPRTSSLLLLVLPRL